jgi:hypothetical protein
MMDDLNVYCPGAAWESSRFPRARYPGVGYVLPGRLWREAMADPELMVLAAQAEWHAAAVRQAALPRERRLPPTYLH